ncbi:MAG: hypothetical protein HGB08_02360 [Candidatus Moranbacteria bacterium]|nr:hypothetical protein [Candidatus Moranbacteria bacterium]
MSKKRTIKNVIGINTGHDGGCALCVDGKIVVAISEERLNRKKNSSGWINSLFYCLNCSKINIRDIDAIVFSGYKNKLPKKYDGGLQSIGFPKEKCFSVDHHLSHACSAFFTSKFNEATIFIYDGHGNGQDTESFYIGNENKITKIGGNPLRDAQRGITKAYEIFTSYFGWTSSEAGKTMGLASYGISDKFCKYPIYSQRIDGFYINNFGSEGYLSDRLSHFCKSNKINIPKCFSENSVNDYKDMAAWVQSEFERAIFGDVEKAIGLTKSENLCLAGGGALNSVCNTKLLNNKKIKNMHIFPAANDSGQCVGNALYGYYVLGKNKRNKRSKWVHDYRGKIYNDNEIGKKLKNRSGFKDDVISRANKYELKEYELNQIPEIVAKLVSEGNIVGWFQGGSELGPRALGHRSIICDPRRRDMKDILNKKVKNREEFRPFAASVLLERMSDYFDINERSPFMLFVAKVKKDKIKKIPAVTHVDNTCRIQTLTKKENGIFYELVKKFYKLTKVPMILNTSFNVAGEPLVETPDDAVRCFLGTEMDYLVIHNYVLKKIL